MSSEMPSSIESLFKFIEDGVRIYIGDGDGFPYVARAEVVPKKTVSLIRLQGESLDQLIVRLTSAIALVKETGNCVYDDHSDRSKFTQNRSSEVAFDEAFSGYLDKLAESYSEYFHEKSAGFELPCNEYLQKTMDFLTTEEDVEHKLFVGMYFSRTIAPSKTLLSVHRFVVLQSHFAVRFKSKGKIDEAMKSLGLAVRYLDEAIELAKTLQPDQIAVSAIKRRGGLALSEKNAPIKAKVIDLLDQMGQKCGWETKDDAINSITLDVEKIFGDSAASGQDKWYSRIMGWSLTDEKVRAAFERNISRKNDANRRR